jgi:glucosylceramidase
VFQQDINHWVTGWVDWNMALDTEGGPNWVNNNVDSPIIINATADEFYKQPMFYALAHFAKFVPPGSRRIAYTISSDSVIECVSFLRPDNIVAVVLQNR